MPLRTTVLLNIGPPFGGFRIALGPRLLGATSDQVFTSLEEALSIVATALQSESPARWHELPPPPLPHVDDREIVIDLTGDATADADGDVVLRTFLPFWIWPLGGWAAYQGWHRSVDGLWSRFSEDEQARLW